MTSNIASTVIEQMVGGDPDKLDRTVREELRRYFRPEFLNRVDEIIIFKPLTREHIERIVDIQMQRVMARLAERKLTLVLTPRAKEKLAQEGYDPAYGARPLRRAIQKLIVDPLALLILEGKFQENDTIRVDVDANGKIVFEKAS
jgi:ATP-dependent Clp protease ATP-binding subunit ClpB